MLIAHRISSRRPIGLYVCCALFKLAVRHLLFKRVIIVADSLDELRQKVAVAMRILALQECVTDIMGHVSARIPGTNDMFIRCRGGNERGLSYTDIQQIRRINFTEKGGATRDDYMVPLEVPIHGEFFERGQT